MMAMTDSAMVAIRPDEEQALNTIDANADVMVARVKDWSRQNSGSWNLEGLHAMRRLIPDAFEAIDGAQAEAVDLPPSEVVQTDGEIAKIEHAPAIVVRQRPDADVQIVLTGHYDTVFPPDFHFQDWELGEGDLINGPGVADMKGGILVMAQALAAAERGPHAKSVGWTVVLSPDEEIGNPASKGLIAEVARRSHVGLTYEPALADGSLAGARKGSGNWTLVVHGRAAHAGREHHLGRNALEGVASFVVGLQSLNGQREGVTFNVGKIEGGGPNNVVPALGICRFNARMTSAEDQPWVEAQIAELVEQVKARDGLDAHLHGGLSRPPKPMTPANATVFGWTKSAGAALGLDIRWKDTGGVCEGNNLWAQGCPNVDTLGVRGGAIHSDEEFAHLNSLPERARLSALIMMKIAAGEFDAAAARRLAEAARS